MSTKPKTVSILLFVLMIVNFLPVPAQEKLSWLDDYTGGIPVGADTYQYLFSNVEGNDCKLKFEERHTNKKGDTETQAWVFYLSDIDASAINFKAKGKAINILMGTRQSQPFITFFEEGELDGYTDEIVISMNEVDMARSFIETIRERISSCQETDVAWNNRDEAFAWLVNNVAKAGDEGIEWDQKFEQGNRSYLVDFKANSVNAKGEQESMSYVFDLSDMNPVGINLKISGKSLMVEVPVKEGKRFIQVNTPAGTSFANEMTIYASGIESARQIVNALHYVVSNTTPERPQWDSYAASLEFVKENLGEVNIGDETYSNGLEFDASPSGRVAWIIGKSGSDGTSESVQYSCYLTDLAESLKLEVSKTSITIRMDSKNKREFISEIKEGKIVDYESSLEIYISDIDRARDVVNALEQAIRSSEEKITEFTSIGEVGSWFSGQIGTIEMDGDQYAQRLSIDEENDNQLILEQKLSEADGGSSMTRFILYPEDIAMDKVEIKVSGKKLFVPLSSGSNRYIKSYENDQLQDFTGSVEVLFDDPMAAKNFIAAIRFLKENTPDEEKTMEKDNAVAYLLQNIQNIKISDDQYDQKLDFQEGGECKLSFTRIETDGKGASEAYIYEFNVSDIHSGNSKFSVKGEIIQINLVTSGNEKLIKPYKDGEAGDFIDDFYIYVDDVMIARKTLAAIAALSESCK